jgi:hypothetical protein
MATADIFTGAKNAYTYMFAYISTVGQDIGMERAVALSTKMCEAMGAAQGMALKQQAAIKEIGLQGVVSLIDKYLEDGLGITSEKLEGDDHRQLIKVGRCPLYEACEVLGMDNATIESLCRAGALRFMDTIVKQFDPAFSYQLQEFRPSAEGSCIEAIFFG